MANPHLGSRFQDEVLKFKFWGFGVTLNTYIMAMRV